MKLKLLGGLLGWVLVSGCQTDLYYWGRYEEAIHYAYAHSDEWDRSGLIDLMESDRSRARKAEKPLPPGWHAHLGLLYHNDGQPDRALAEFAAEKQLFPEATPFMNRLLDQQSPDHQTQRTNQPVTTLYEGGSHLAGSTAPANP